MKETMADVGEKNFIKNVLPRLYVDASFLNGFGHDASVIDVGFQDQLLVMKIDRAGSPIATSRGWANYRMWGRLAVTANCSDILAAGGSPKAMMICVCVPRTWLTEDVTDILLGCEEECSRWRVAFVGGDTKESSEPVVVGSAVGLVDRNHYLSRNGGRPGQLVVLAGLIGGYVGSYLQLVYRHLDTTSLKQREEWVHYLAHPTAKWVEAAIVRRHGWAIAGMDTSDGLYDTLVSITSDQMGIEVDLAAMPYHPSMLECSQALGMPLFNAALGVGDWDIVYVVEEDCIEQMKQEARANHAHLTVIGKLTETPGVTARDSEDRHYLVQGIVNENFKSRMEDQQDFIEQIRSQVSLIPL